MLRLAGIARDGRVRAAFGRVVYAPLGQKPQLRDLQRSVYRQLSGAPLDSRVTTSELVLQALRAAALGQELLLILDDAWDARHAQLFTDCMDPQTGSCALVSTRVQGLIGDAHEVPLGLLPRDEAARLLLSVGGADAAPPYSAECYAAVEACGRLPLVLAVAGGMLADQYGGDLTQGFVELISESHGEVLRQGEFGDEMVSLEDRLITSSLNGYVGAERAQVCADAHRPCPLRNASKEERQTRRNDAHSPL